MRLDHESVAAPGGTGRVAGGSSPQDVLLTSTALCAPDAFCWRPLRAVQIRRLRIQQRLRRREQKARATASALAASGGIEEEEDQEELPEYPSFIPFLPPLVSALPSSTSCYSLSQGLASPTLHSVPSPGKKGRRRGKWEEKEKGKVGGGRKPLGQVLVGPPCTCPLGKLSLARLALPPSPPHPSHRGHVLCVPLVPRCAADVRHAEGVLRHLCRPRLLHHRLWGHRGAHGKARGPWGGEQLAASAQGSTCWHVRSSLLPLMSNIMHL